MSKWRMVNDSMRGYSEFLKNPGIYAFKEFNVPTQKFAVVYIGKSHDLFSRLGTWHRVEALWRKRNGTEKPIQLKYLYCFILVTSDYHEKEKRYIKRLAPRYNKMLNPKVKRMITYTEVE